MLTNKPLWPWPMEERVKAESGVSVTWESDGGLWKTLGGVYGGSSTLPTATPTNLPTITPTPSVDLEQLLVSWLKSIGDRNGDGKVNSGDWAIAVSL